MAVPFHSDPSQRILALKLGGNNWFVFDTEQLIEVARKWGGQRLGSVSWARLYLSDSGTLSNHVWVSGCLLLCIVPPDTDNEHPSLRIYDFNCSSRAKNLNATEGERERKMFSISI